MKHTVRNCWRIFQGIIGVWGLVGCALDVSLIEGALNLPSTEKALPTLSITGPVVTSGDIAASFVFTVNYENADSVSLAVGDIILGGTDTTGCEVAVSGTGASTRTVTVTKCSGDGTMNISVASGTAINPQGELAPALGESSAANVRNSIILIFDTTKVTVGSSAANAVRIPLSNWTDYDFSVSWGDGDSTPVTLAGGNNLSVNHVYDDPGVYEVRIKGADLSHLMFCDRDETDKIQDVKQWGPNPWASMDAMFADCSRLQVSAPDAPNLSLGPNMINMFAETKVFNSPIEHWDVSKVKDMESMFRGAEAFNQPLEKWDMSSVTNISGMFAGAIVFNQPLGAWNTEKVIDMSGAFRSAKKFNQNLSGWNTGNVEDMGGMFNSADDFNGDISTWNTAKVIQMGGMFSYTLAFNQPINKGAGSIWDTSKVKYMEGMFEGAKAFNQDIGSWDTSSVTTMSAMFLGADLFNKPIGAWNTLSVTSMYRTFAGAAAFNQNIATWNTSAVTNMQEMFAWAGSFNQNLSGWNVTSVAQRADFDIGTGGSWVLAKPNFP